MSASPIYPGVSPGETPGRNTIAGVSTSVAAFVGTTARGPLNVPVPLCGFADFERSFGGLDPASELSYAVWLFFLNGGTEAYAVRVAAGATGAIYVDATQPKHGIHALDDVEVFNLLVLAGVSDASTINDAAAYCEQRDAFLIVDPPKAQQPPQMQALAAGTTLTKSDHAALFWPYISVADPVNGGLRLTAPSGALAGVFARTDAQHGIWKAPAGTAASLAGAQALEYTVTDRESALLHPCAVNCLRATAPYGIISWGARTRDGFDASSQYQYIPVRRLASYIRLSLFRGTRWFLSEPNAEPLWSQIRVSIGAFMDTFYRQGAFQGRTARDAYFVKCGSETSTQTEIDAGVVTIHVGFAPLRPAEFVIIALRGIAGRPPG